ncbi:MAG TPA: MFS transporter [Nocardioidaceae bacterium]|jgi:MFS family permease|nr:MFS transporter [Nocardioidaceae bacterium]
MKAARQLRYLLRGQWFRRLFAVRLSSQYADGVFQVALASYVIFSPERQPSPTAIAAALATVLLPFSVLGPFAGVLLDRWSRREVLAISNFIRVGLLLLLSVGMLSDLRGPWLFLLILVCLSVNRFLLAGLSASLPHVVRRDDLMVANSLTPTAGTLAVIVGLGTGAGLHLVADRLGVDGDVAVVWSAAVLYAAAGALALRIPRDLLGPDFDPTLPAVREQVRHVARGMVDGLRHLVHHGPAAHGLMAIGLHRFWYGISTVSLILLYRNYFHPHDVDAAFNGLSLAVLVSGAGYVTAAVVTPMVTDRVTPRTWILTLLGVAALTQVFPAALYTVPALLAASFVLGVASQGIKICVDTLVQAYVDDAFRGRVFSLYDVIFNVAFVAAAAVAAVVLPETGKSYPVLALVAVGYAATALGYAMLSRTPVEESRGLPEQHPVR